MRYPWRRGASLQKSEEIFNATKVPIPPSLHFATEISLYPEMGLRFFFPSLSEIPSIRNLFDKNEVSELNFEMGIVLFPRIYILGGVFLLNVNKTCGLSV